MAARSDGPSIVPVADEDLAVGASYRMTFRDGDDGLEAVDIHGRTITRITKTPIKMLQIVRSCRSIHRWR